MDSGVRAKSTVERSLEIEFVRRAELEKAEQEIGRLREENAQLRRQLETARRGQKRQAAPFSKGEPKENPKKPGRKSGDKHGAHHRRAVPERVDEHYVAALASKCGCGGAVELEKTKRQIQEDIVRRKVVREFKVEIGRCAGCGQYHQGHHPLQTSDALDAAGVQVGPEAVALVTILNKRMGLSLGRAVEVLRTGYGLKMSRGGAWRAMERLAGKAKPTYEAACEVVKQSLVVWIDETGWKVGGRLQWLWVAVSERATVYRIQAGRGYQQAVQLVGAGFTGCLVHDGWAPYLRFQQALHQSCLQHIVRRCRTMIDIGSQSGVVELASRVKEIAGKGMEVRDRRERREISEQGMWTAAGRLAAELERVLSLPWMDEADLRLVKHLRRQQPHLFTYLHCPGVEATNNRGERAIRPAVMARKVWGGSRTANGAMVQQVLVSVLETCHQQAKDSFDWVTGLLRGSPAVVLDLAARPGSG